MPRRMAAIAAISFGTALAVIDGSIVFVALPTIAHDLQADNSSVVLVVTVYQLILVMTLLPLSSLGDIVGLKRLYLGGQILFAISTLLCFFAHSLPYLLIARAFQALGAGATLSVSTTLLRSIFPANQLGRGLAIHTLVIAVSSVIAPTLGGGILAIASWPWVFASAVPFALASLLLGRTLPDVPQREGDFDLLAAGMCVATFGLVMSGLESGVHGDSPVVSLFLVAVGILIGTIFVRRELKIDHPIMPVDLLGRPLLAMSAIGSFTAFLAQMTLLISLPFRLQHGYGFSPTEIGVMMAAYSFATMIVGPLAGILSDRYPAGLLGGFGMGVAVVALLSLAWLPDHLQYFDVAWRMAMCGAGFGLFLVPNARLFISTAPRHRAAAAGGLIPTIRLSGQTLGATVAAVLLAWGLGDGATPALVAAGLAGVAGLASLARLRPALRERDEAEISPI